MKLSKIWVAFLVVVIIAVAILASVYIGNSKDFLTFNAVDDPPTGLALWALKEVTVKPTGNTGPNNFAKLKVVTEYKNPYYCPDNYTPKVTMPFYKDSIADRVVRDGRPYERSVGVATIENPAYPGRLLLGYDQYFDIDSTSNSNIIYAKLRQKFEKIRKQPKMIDKAVAMSAETWYTEGDIVGRLEVGNKVNFGLSLPVPICERASGGGSGGGG